MPIERWVLELAEQLRQPLSSDEERNLLNQRRTIRTLAYAVHINGWLTPSEALEHALEFPCELGPLADALLAKHGWAMFEHHVSQSDPAHHPSPLLKAVQGGDPEWCRRVLDARATLDLRPYLPYAMSPLVMACSRKSWAIASMLLEHDHHDHARHVDDWEHRSILDVAIHTRLSQAHQLAPAFQHLMAEAFEQSQPSFQKLVATLWHRGERLVRYANSPDHGDLLAETMRPWFSEQRLSEAWESPTEDPPPLSRTARF